MTLVRRGAQDLTHYDPEVGIASIATQEQAEKFWSRAKDLTRLQEAVERKLAEQRKFVLWWDSVERRGRPKKNPADRRYFLTDFGLDDDALGRWRAHLKTEAKFHRAVAAALEKAARVCEFRKGQTGQRGASGTGDEEWFTPVQYIEMARDVLGDIDLDPATHELAQAIVKATRYHTREDDGLTKPWRGRVWLNPPYMQPDIAEFVAKLVEEVAAERTTAAILLTHNYTDTTWFHHAAGHCSAICFTRGRVRFVNPDGDEASPTQGQAFFYFGVDSDRFVLRFADIGFVVKPT